MLLQKSQKYLKTKSQKYYSGFKKYRNKINHLMRITKNNYYNYYFSNDSRMVRLVNGSIINNEQVITGKKAVEEFSKYLNT